MSVKPERYKKQRHPQEEVRLVLTVAQAKAYCETCWSGALIVLRSAEEMNPGCEKESALEVGRELLRLAHGFGRRVEKGDEG